MIDLTVVCPVKNPGPEILATASSIVGQTGVSIEVVVVSANGQSEHLITALERLHRALRTTHLSGNNSGIAGAFNAGVRDSAGDYLLFLGSGDHFLYPDVCDRAIQAASESDPCELVIGQVAVCDPLTSQTVRSGPAAFRWEDLKYRMAIPHQGLFTRRSYFDRYGLFDESFRYAMDYELILRSYHARPSYVFLDRVVAAWMTGGIGANDTLGVLREYHRAREMHHVGTPVERAVAHASAVTKHVVKSAVVEPFMRVTRK